MPRIGKGYARLHTIYFSIITIVIFLMWLCQSFIPVSASEVARDDGMKLYVDDNLYYVKLDTLDLFYAVSSIRLLPFRLSMPRPLKPKR